MNAEELYKLTPEWWAQYGTEFSGHGYTEGQIVTQDEETGKLSPYDGEVPAQRGDPFGPPPKHPPIP